MRLPSAVLPLLLLSLAACATGTTGSDDPEQSDNAFTSAADQCTSTSVALNPSWMKTETLSLEDGALKVRVGTMGSGDRGDVLYLPGFADRFDNHRPLFESLVEAGLRVISFDYPSHGETCGKSIDSYGFGELAELAGKVEHAKASAGPLYLAGWSTGGLLAVRIAQGIRPNALSRPIAGMTLLAPGVDVRTVISVTEESLTSNRSAPHVAPPKPSSPALRPIFAGALLLNSGLSRAQQLPPAIPTLVVTGGETEDRFVKTANVVSWAKAQREGGAEITGLGCAGAFHELDNEPGGTGQTVRDATAKFLATAGSESPTSSTCKAY